MREKEVMIQSIISKLRGSQKDPCGLPFKLAGMQHVYQISGMKTSEEYMQNYMQ